MFSFRIMVKGAPEEFRFADKAFVLEHEWGKSQIVSLKVAGKVCRIQHTGGTLSGLDLKSTLRLLGVLCKEYYHEEREDMPPFWRRITWWYEWEIAISEHLRDGNLKAEILSVERPECPFQPKRGRYEIAPGVWAIRYL